VAARQLKLGVIMKGHGSHIAGWRHPSVDLAKATHFSQYADIARIAEGAKLDFVFLADSPSVSYMHQPVMLARVPQVYHIEPVTLLSALAPLTRHIGLVGTITTTFSEPYNVARMFASLDHISDGRACWNVVTTTNDQTAPNFGRDEQMSKPERYARASEFVDVVRGLWDSWEEDAFIMDRASGIYADPDKMHFLDYRSERFAVRGPLNVPRTPQGQPVVCVAADSEDGRELAARAADLMFNAQLSIDNARVFYKDVKARMAKYGRKPSDLSIVLGCTFITGRTDEEAKEKYAFLESLIDVEIGMQYLNYLALRDLSGYPLDEPLPAILKEDRSRSRLNIVVDAAERDGLTLRQTAIRYADSFGHLRIMGSGKSVADQVQEWYETEAADGFVIRMAYAPESLTDFNTLVLPELQKRGLFRTEYTGKTFRENLGLPKPVSMHASG